MNASSSVAISFSAAFFRIGAAAAVLSVVGVVLAQIILRPAAVAAFENGPVEAYADPAFQALLLTILIQVMAMFVALLALVVKVFPTAPGFAVLAAACLIFWQVLELVPRSIEYFTFALDYAENFAAGASDAAFIEEELRRFEGLAGGMQRMRQVVWSGVFLLLGFAASSRGGLGRWLGAVFVMNGLRVAALFAAGLAGAALPFGPWPFVVFSVASFSLLAIWLWSSPAQERRS